MEEPGSKIVKRKRPDSYDFQLALALGCGVAVFVHHMMVCSYPKIDAAGAVLLGNVVAGLFQGISAVFMFQFVFGD